MAAVEKTNYNWKKATRPPKIQGTDFLVKYGKRRVQDGAIFIAMDDRLADDLEKAGKDVIALKDPRNASRLIDEIESNAPNCPLILMLNARREEDAETDEVITMNEIAEGLEARGIYYAGPFEPRDYEPGCDLPKLYDYPTAFKENLDGIQEKATAERIAWIDARLKELADKSAAGDLDAFLNEILNGGEAAPVPTGFRSLDKMLDGGLYPALYAIGAISSLGKTTLAMQIADQIAAAGERDVMIFSLEMDSRELEAKSISRYTYKMDPGRGQNAKTTRAILTGRFAPEDPRRGEEMDLVKRAVGEYRKAAAHIFIVEGIGDVGIGKIRKDVADHTRISGRAPVVITDYLQILAPNDPRATDKQNTDKAVLELKRISRDFHTPVIAISSFNRSNYDTPVNNAAFKESGAIEYSADVLMGLQYAFMDYEDAESDAPRTKRIRAQIAEAEEIGKHGGDQKIQIKILKNRNGARGNVILTYTPMFNYFRDDAGLEEIHTPAPKF